MAPDDSTARRLAATARGVPAPWSSPASWLAALRAGERAALTQAYVSYLPLLRYQGQVMGVPEEERNELAVTVLGDVLLHLQSADVPPREFVRYLVGAFRNRARNARRGRLRLLSAQEGAYTAWNDGRERIVAECQSEYAVRHSAGPAPESRDLTANAVQRLAEFSAQQLSTDELAMIVGLCHHVPLRELAERAGVSYAAARQRLARLRARFLLLARQHLETLHVDERRELERFFRRADVALADDARPGARRARAGITPSSRRDGATGDASSEGPDDDDPE